MKGRIILSSRGKKLFVLESVPFKKSKVLKSGETFWRCMQPLCKAKVFTVGAEYVITRSDLQHSHDKDIKKLNRKIINSCVKKMALKEPTETPLKLITAAVEQNCSNTEALSEKDISYIRNNMHYTRRKSQPLLFRRTTEEDTNVSEIQETCTEKDNNEEQALTTDNTEPDFTETAEPEIEDFNIKQVEDLNIKQEHIDLPSTELHSESQIDYNQDDVYNHFGQYIASLLRTIGPPKAMRLQAKITALVVDEMCSPTNAIENN